MVCEWPCFTDVVFLFHYFFIFSMASLDSNTYMQPWGHTSTSKVTYIYCLNFFQLQLSSQNKGLQYSTWDFIFMEKDNLDECFDKTGKAILGEVALLLYSGFLLL